MKMFTLRRRYFENMTFGEMLDAEGKVVCVTVECPWRNNLPNESCIPEGSYQLFAHTSPSKGNCLALEADSLGVTLAGPSLRTACLIHVANRASELQGCIAPGSEFGVVHGEWAVLSSRKTLETLLTLIGDEPARLTIVRD